MSTKDIRLHTIYYYMFIYSPILNSSRVYVERIQKKIIYFLCLLLYFHINIIL